MDVERCPLLGQSMEAGTLICLADIEPVAVSRRYGDSYCLTSGHVNCSLYISAVLADRSKAPPLFADIEIVPERVPVETAPAHEPATVVEETPAAPLTREQAIELARELSDRVDSLAQQVQERRAVNEALVRQVRTLEEMAENPAFLRRVLATGEKEPMAASDLKAIQDSLQRLLENPQDLGGLVQLAEQSPKLERAVNACLQILRTRG
jgi:hypothetical protein